MSEAEQERSTPASAVPEHTAQGQTTTWDRSWRSFTSIQGGLIVGHAVAAALADLTSTAGRRPVVRTSTTHFLQAVAPDLAVTARVEPDRLGSTSSVRSGTWQAGTLRAVTQVLAIGSAPGSSTTHAGDLPAGFVGPEGGEALVQPADFVPFTTHLEFRALGTGRPLAGGAEPRLTAWVRLREPAHLPDATTQLGVLVDCLPPSLYAVLSAPVIVPTVELTLHVIGTPPPLGAWVRVDQWTAWQDGGVCVDEADLHDEQGSLVARVRQTRRLPR
ncbi:thioesterase family protein [Nakamurella flavida]|uniref:Thioesterase family protein n=1 Tax=Nakamurella flavida TaxID=363630 RepID=A0A939BZ46_9ACTN|nr:thioesterase family protein [Nakamurella flavida]MBM9475348.1 thioesterase family protein [Nakamurella flavida]MDP9776925.1 acyl-CoA thioesterase [Nakamurella flavida]